MSSLTFIPDLAVILKYTAAVLVLFALPGPDMILCLSKTMTHGRRAAFSCQVGISCGLLVHTFLAAFSVSAILAASETAFFILKIMGALYLIWLAISVLRSGSELNINPNGQEKASVAPTFRRNFLTGLGINLANPKVVLFFITFLPQFVSAADPHAQGKLVFLGMFFVVFTAPLMCLLIMVAHNLTSLLKRNPKVLRAVDYLFAGVFVSFAVGLLFTENGGQR